MELTQEQERVLLQYQGEWMKHLVSTEPCNRKAAEPLFERFYGTARGRGKPGFPYPGTMWVDSPYAAAKEIMRREGRTGRVEHSDTWLWGQGDSLWCALYKFRKDVLEVDFGEDTEDLEAWAELATYAHWWWAYDEICIASERPILTKYEEVDGEVRLHCTDGPANLYKDGFAMYAWHGSIVPAYVMEGELTPDVIKREKNSEYRRMLLSRYGLLNYIEEAGAAEISRDDHGILYEIPQDDEQNIRVVLVENSTPEVDGSFRKYTLAVPPDAETPGEALAAIGGISNYRNAVYKPSKES